MSTDGTVTYLIQQAKEGDADSATKLFDLFFKRVVGLARKKLGAEPRRAFDEEDVALSVFAQLFKKFDRFSGLSNRNELRQLLFKMTSDKAIERLKRERTKKRGGGNVRGDSVFAAMSDSESESCGLKDAVVDCDPPPALFTLQIEDSQILLGMLSERQRSIALLRLEGCPDEEIAMRCGCGLRTVERNIHVIKEKWHRRQERNVHP